MSNNPETMALTLDSLNKREELKLVFAVYVLVFLFHIAFVWDQQLAKIAPDEVSYLAQAKYFAGSYKYPDTFTFSREESMAAFSEVFPDTTRWPYYHFGYSLLVTPIYWLAEDAEVAYKLVIIFNGLLVSSLFVFIFFWIKLLFVADFSRALLIAAVTSLYPAYTYHAYIGWAENAIVPFVALSVLLYSYYLKTEKLVLLIIFALVAGFLYTIHPRGIAFSIGAIFCLVALIFIKKERWLSALTGIVIVAGVVVISRDFSTALSILMSAGQQEERIADDVLGFWQLNIWPQLIGHFLYMILATLGVFLIGFVYLIGNLGGGFSGGIGHLISQPRSGVSVYIFVSCAALFSASVLFNSPSYGFELNTFNGAIDRYLYGRYNEAAISVFVAMGLVYLCELQDSGSIRRHRKLLFISLVLLTVVCGFYLFYLQGVLASIRGMSPMHLPALFPWFVVALALPGWLNLLGFFVGPLFWTWIVYLASLDSSKNPIHVVAAYFVLMGLSLAVYLSPSLRISGNG